MKHRCNTRHTSRVLLLIIFGFVAACGQKGPLEYTPKQQSRIEVRDQARAVKHRAAEREEIDEETDNAQESDNAQVPAATQENGDDPTLQR